MSKAAPYEYLELLYLIVDGAAVTVKEVTVHFTTILTAFKAGGFVPLCTVMVTWMSSLDSLGSLLLSWISSCVRWK